METSFAELLAGLAIRKIRFILVGGLAVDLCGFHRSTFDIELKQHSVREKDRVEVDFLRSQPGAEA